MDSSGFSGLVSEQVTEGSGEDDGYSSSLAFGSSSLYLRWLEDYLKISKNSSTDFNIGTGDFTFEAFVHLSSHLTESNQPYVFTSFDKHIKIFW